MREPIGYPVAVFTSPRRLPALLSGVAAIALMTGCTNSEQVASPEELAAAAATTTTAASSSEPQPQCDVKVEGAFNQLPNVTIPAGCAAPTTLISKDLVQGKGDALKKGDRVQVYYHLVSWTDKTVKDSSWSSSVQQTQPLETVIGTGQVIAGWDRGLIGVRNGGRRLLVVPPALGYPNGQGKIKANDTLVFVIDVVKITPAN